MKYQNVIITLSDGSEHIFTGKEFAKPGDKRIIRSIKFTEPKELPTGYAFELATAKAGSKKRS